MAQTPSMSRLIQELTRLPGIGEKTAGRLAFHILRADRAYAQALADALLAVKDETRLCSRCFALTEADPCPICSDPTRSGEAICVVEEPADLLAVERAREFRGRYHVLHGTLAPLDGVGPDELKIQPLLVRLRDGAVREVILATNPTAEGEATALYLARLIKPLGLRVTRIAHGIPVGGDLEYVDVVTVGRALEGRREM
jgi:recombination protein RecR